jgi:hypothetical protein
MPLATTALALKYDMTLQKRRLEGNVTLKANQSFTVQGMNDAKNILITRDAISTEIGVIELPDQTRVPGGRQKSGDFSITLQFCNDQDRNAYARWYNQCIAPSRDDHAGISPYYKRTAELTYYRLFSGDPGGYDSGTDLKPVHVKLFGCWPSTMELPEGDIDSDDGDAYCTLNMTINFDEAILQL